MYPGHLSNSPERGNWTGLLGIVLGGLYAVPRLVSFIRYLTAQIGCVCMDESTSVICKLSQLSQIYSFSKIPSACGQS